MLSRCILFISTVPGRLGTDFVIQHIWEHLKTSHILSTVISKPRNTKSFTEKSGDVVYWV